MGISMLYDRRVPSRVMLVCLFYFARSQGLLEGLCDGLLPFLAPYYPSGGLFLASCDRRVHFEGPSGRVLLHMVRSLGLFGFLRSQGFSLLPWATMCCLVPKYETLLAPILHLRHHRGSSFEACDRTSLVVHKWSPTYVLHVPSDRVSLQHMWTKEQTVDHMVFYSLRDSSFPCFRSARLLA